MYFFFFLNQSHCFFKNLIKITNKCFSTDEILSIEPLFETPFFPTFFSPHFHTWPIHSIFISPFYLFSFFSLLSLSLSFFFVFFFFFNFNSMWHSKRFGISKSFDGTQHLPVFPCDAYAYGPSKNHAREGGVHKL